MIKKLSSEARPETLSRLQIANEAQTAAPQGLEVAELRLQPSGTTSRTSSRFSLRGGFLVGSLVTVTLVFFALTVHADGPRTLTESLPAGAIESLELDTGVGDVEITARSNRDEVVIAVLLTPRRGGFFSSKRQAEREVAEARLSTTTAGQRLILSIEPKSKDQRFEEHWTIEIPARLEVNLDHGVGDVKIRGVAGGLGIDSGVGEILVEIPEGDVVINLGVGTAVVRAPASAYASAEGAGGVGDARISVQGTRISSEGFIGHSARWTGDGTFHIEVEVGVGDAVINLK